MSQTLSYILGLCIERGKSSVRRLHVLRISIGGLSNSQHYKVTTDETIRLETEIQDSVDLHWFDTLQELDDCLRDLLQNHKYTVEHESFCWTQNGASCRASPLCINPIHCMGLPADLVLELISAEPCISELLSTPHRPKMVEEHEDIAHDLKQAVSHINNARLRFSELLGDYVAREPGNMPESREETGNEI